MARTIYIYILPWHVKIDMSPGKRASLNATPDIRLQIATAKQGLHISQTKPDNIITLLAANTSEWQREWLLKRSLTVTGAWWGGMKNTYWWKCWERICQWKGREDNWKQDGKMCANDTWKVLDWEQARIRTGRCGEGRSAESGRGYGQGGVEKEDHQSYEGKSERKSRWLY